MSNPSLAKDLLGPALVALAHDARRARERVLATSDGARGDDEALHDFRVALRRARTLLRVARAVWGRKRLARIEGELRYYAQTTGALRDEEVLRETLGALSLPPEARAEVGAWLVRRARAARDEHAEVARLLREGPAERVPAVPGGKRVRRLDDSLAVLEERLEQGDAEPRTTQDLGTTTLDLAARDIARWAAEDVNDASAMHELRIRYKRLRYAAELFAAPLGVKAARLAKHAARMQKRLGELHDLDQALLTVGHARELGASRGAVLSALRATRAASAAKVAPHVAKAQRLADRAPDDENIEPV